MALDFDLSDEHALFRDTVRGFAEGRIGPQAQRLDSEGVFPVELVGEAAELGLLGIPLPEQWGGAGSDTLAYAIAIEELARVDSSFAITVAAHTSLGTMPIHLFGDDDQKARWLPDLASGRRLASFGLTEAGAGSDAGASRTTARLEGDEWVIDGAKMFITNAGTPISALVTLTARTGDDEISNIVVENGTPGYAQSPPLKKMGWRSSDTRELTFEGCRVPEGNLLGPRGNGFRQFLEILDGGRIGVAALGLGMAQGAFELGLQYAKEREQFGRPIGQFQLVQDLLVKMLGNATASLGMMVRLAQLQDAGIYKDEHSALAKAFCTVRMRESVGWARELLGGNGIVLDYNIARFVADAEAIYSYEGTREINTLIVGRAVTGLGAFV